MTYSELYIRLLERAAAIRKYIYRRIPRRLRRIVSADDVLQEVWISAFRSIPQFFDDSPDAFDRWLTSIARSRLLNNIRRSEQNRRIPGRLLDAEKTGSYVTLAGWLADQGRTPSSEHAGHEAVHAIRLALSDLPDEYRRVITMHHIDGRSRAEVAAVMNKTVNAVNSLLYRGMIQLRERMGAPGRFFSDTDFKVESPT